MILEWSKLVDFTRQALQTILPILKHYNLSILIVEEVKIFISCGIGSILGDCTIEFVK